MKSDIMSGKKTIIDTSVWIDYFRKQSAALSEAVDAVLSGDDVYIPKIVMAELIQGAKSQKEILIIEDFIDTFKIIDQKEDTGIEAGKLLSEIISYIIFLSSINACYKHVFFI